tara:strand:+ start:2795 stop:3094 length:300 start_codon:yes stop_codon:yes gene_type:complete
MTNYSDENFPVRGLKIIILEEIETFSYFIDALPIRCTFSSLKKIIFSAVPLKNESSLFDFIKEGMPFIDMILLISSYSADFAEILTKLELISTLFIKLI